MKSRAVHLLPIVLMLLLAALTLWLRQAIEGPTFLDPGTRRHDPDAIIENFTITRMDEKGIPQYRLSAKRMFHFADDDSTELIAPHFVKRSEGSDVTVTSERGRVTRDYEEAFFHGNVEMVRVGTREAPEMKVRSEYLHVLSKKDLILSDRLVTILEGSSTISGTGMEYNRRTRQFALYARVKGSFDAPKKH